MFKNEKFKVTVLGMELCWPPICQNDCICVNLLRRFVCIIYYKSILLECCCLSHLFFIFCVWLLLWQTTVCFPRWLLFTSFTCFLYSFKDMDRFSLCFISLLSFYKHDILEFFPLKFFILLLYCTQWCCSSSSFISLCNFRNNHECV